MPNPSFEQAEKIAQVLGRYIDEPSQSTYSNPSYSGDPRYQQFISALNKVIPGFGAQGYNPQQFGETQNPAQYRGIRLLLPQSGGEYEATFKESPVPGQDKLRQMILGYLINAGYPVLGGTGQMPGYEKGFNPIGFGQK